MARRCGCTNLTARHNSDTLRWHDAGPWSAPIRSFCVARSARSRLSPRLIGCFAATSPASARVLDRLRLPRVVCRAAGLSVLLPAAAGVLPAAGLLSARLPPASYPPAASTRHSRATPRRRQAPALRHRADLQRRLLHLPDGPARRVRCGLLLPRQWRRPCVGPRELTQSTPHANDPSARPDPVAPPEPNAGDRRLCADRRLPHRGAGQPGRLDRLALLAALRQPRRVRRLARHASQRPLAHRARTRRTLA